MPIMRVMPISMPSMLIVMLIVPIVRIRPSRAPMIMRIIAHIVRIKPITAPMIMRIIAPIAYYV